MNPVDLKQFLPLLAQTTLFAGLEGAQLDTALEFFHAQRVSFRQGAFLAQPGEPLLRFGLVLAGTVEVSMLDLGGDTAIMHVVEPGETFGESLCYLQTPDAPICICAATDGQLFWLELQNVRRGGEDELSRLLTGRFIAMLAQRTLAMNSRIQILCKSTLREKLVTFFSECVQKTGSPRFTVPFDRAGMASYLGADRSALSRELSRMRREGLIDFEKNSFQILRSSTRANT